MRIIQKYTYNKARSCPSLACNTKHSPESNHSPWLSYSQRHLWTSPSCCPKDTRIHWFKSRCTYRVSQGTSSKTTSLNLFATFSRQPTSTFMILETITTKFSQSQHFQNVVCLFVLSIPADIKNFVQISILLIKNKNCRNLNELLLISGTEKADHIFCD